MKKLQEKTVKTGSKQVSKQVYVKPTMEMYEMEVEGAIMGDASDGGYYERESQAPSSPSFNNFPWDNESEA